MEDSLHVEQIAKAVSRAVTSVLSKRKKEDAEAASDNSGDSPRPAPSLSRPVTKKKRRYAYSSTRLSWQ